MGQTHLRALAGSDVARIDAAAEPALPTRNELATRGLAVHGDIDAMLDAGGIDGVLIAAPSDLHLDLVRRVAVAGLPILCEKPCGTTAADAREAARIAKASGVPLQVAYWRRFVPVLRELRRRIADGAMGPLCFVACYQWDAAPPPRSFRAGSGGIFIDMGVHEFDQLRWLTGQEIATISPPLATIASDSPAPGDADSAQALCTLSAGTTALVSLGRYFSPGDACWTRVFGMAASDECRFLWPPDGDAAFLDALRRQAEGFAQAVNGAAGEAASAEDAVAALVAAEQATRELRFETINT
jgi:myo-inositol 2-dehydrogenase/D-chiro-inositol 1-dehydrogenase